MGTTDPLYQLVELWREGKVRQIILMDHRAARTFPDDAPLEWPWSILVEDQRDEEGYEHEHLSRMPMSGKTPDEAATKALRWSTDAKYRERVNRNHDRAMAHATQERIERRMKEKADAQPDGR